MQGVGSVNVAGQIGGLHGTRGRGYNGAGRLASSMIEGGRWHTQVAFGFWGGIDWKPLAFAKGLGRGRARDGAVLPGRFGGL